MTHPVQTHRGPLTAGLGTDSGGLFMGSYCRSLSVTAGYCRLLSVTARSRPCPARAGGLGAGIGAAFPKGVSDCCASRVGHPDVGTAGAPAAVGVAPAFSQMPGDPRCSAPRPVRERF